MISSAAASPVAQSTLRAVDEIRRFIHHTADTQRPDRLWPAHSAIFDTNPLSVAYGACGTAVFLKETQTEVPADVLNWIAEHELNEAVYPPGLYVGLSGIAVACSTIGLRAKAEDAMHRALQSPLCLTSPSFGYGGAGIGWAALFLHAQTGDDSLLAIASTVGDFLVRTAERDEGGVFWRDDRGRIPRGFAYGGAGIAVFLAALGAATQRADVIELATGASRYEIGLALLELDDLDWVGLGRQNPSPYFFRGAAGIGSAAIAVARVSDNGWLDDSLRQIANRLDTRTARLPGQWDGFAGIGEFFLDLHEHTGEESYSNAAAAIAECALMFRIETTGGLALPGYSQRHVSCDFAMGSAGVGLFLARCVTRGPRPWVDIRWADSTRTGESARVPNSQIAATAS